MCEENKEIRPVKPALSFEEQLDKIKARGCVIGDENWAIDILKQINYYRLTAYFLPYKEPDETYAEGTTFNNMYQTYEFDRKLRYLLYSTIEEIEIMLRAQLSYYHAHKYGPLGYENKDNFSNFHNHDVFMDKINEDIERNKHKPAVSHHIEYYGGKFPIWVIVELFTVSQLSFFYSDMKRSDMKTFAKQLYNTTSDNLRSWLKCFSELRNQCAHYSRLYNFELLSCPATPIGFPHKLGHRIFDYILVLKFLYYDPIRWSNIFIVQLNALIEEYQPFIDLSLAGFPENWEELLKTPNPTLTTNKDLN